MALKPESQYKSAVGNGLCAGCTFSDGILKEFKWEGKYVRGAKLTAIDTTCAIDSDAATQIEAVATFTPSGKGQPTEQKTHQEVPPTVCHIKRKLYPDSKEPEVIFD